MINPTNESPGQVIMDKPGAAPYLNPFQRQLDLAVKSPQSRPIASVGTASPFSAEIPEFKNERSGGVPSLLIESNFALLGIVEAIDASRDWYTGRNADLNFDAKKFAIDLGVADYGSKAEVEYLNSSVNYEQFSSRMREIREERNRLEAISEMGFGSQIAVGLLGGATDPTSYIPFVGQGARATGVTRSAANAVRVLQQGGSTAAARQALRAGGFSRGFWLAAGEAAAIETAFQATLIGTSVNKEDRIDGAALSIAMTAGVSGLIGGSLGAFSRRGKRFNTSAKEEVVGMLVEGRIFETVDDAAGAVDKLFSTGPGWISPMTAKIKSGTSSASEVAGSVKEAVKRTLNRPRKALEPVSPVEAAQGNAFRSVASKLDETRGPHDKAVLAQLRADAANGIGNWIKFARESFGRGMAPLIADKGRVTFVAPTPPGAKPRTMSLDVKTGRIKQSPDGPPVVGIWRKSKNGKKEIIIDPELAVEKWDELKETYTPLISGLDPEKASVEELAGSVEMMRRGDLSETPEEYIDWVVLHEAAHQMDEKVQNALEARVRKDLLSKKLAPEEIDAHVNNIIEGVNNARVMRWIEEMSEGGPRERKDIVFRKSDGMSPMENSIPLKPGEVPKAGVIANYQLQGLSLKASEKAAQWLSLTNPLARGAMSVSKGTRMLTQRLFGGPFYVEGGTPAGGSVQTRVMFEYEAPIKIARKNAKKGFSEIETNSPITWEAFSERVFAASAKNDTDVVQDAYSSLVTSSAKELRKTADKIESRGVMVGWLKDQEFPNGESWYRRSYNNMEVKGPAFMEMLKRNGIRDKSAVMIRKSILSNGQSLEDNFSGEIRDRGAIKARGREMRKIPFEELSPFLQRDAFEVYLSSAKTMGGEVELRHAVKGVADELGVRDVLYEVGENGDRLTDDQIKANLESDTPQETRIAFDIEPLREAIKAEFSGIRNKDNLILDIDNISLKYKRDWGTGSELAKMYPEDAKRLEEFANDEIVASKISEKNLMKEESFALKWLDDMVETIQHTRDTPNNPDSWIESRIPTLIKNYSHSIMGGKLAISNLADFHRSTAEYGIKHAFSNEWGLMMKDIEAFRKRGAVTEQVGLMLEDQSAEIQRNLRNFNEHYIGETGVERFSQTAASFTSKYNFMDKIANTHQRMFSSAAQGYIIKHVGAMADGTIGRGDFLKMQRMGISPNSALKIKEAFDEGGLKKTGKGTGYLDFDEMSTEVKTELKAAITTAVMNTQTVPSRAELFDWQVQGWGSVFMMYRNWVSAANTRIASAVMSNPDMALMSGAIASVGLGALVTTVKAMVNNDDSVFKDPGQFLRRSIDNGGYLGLVGEANAMVAKITGGVLDMNPIGDGSSRYYDETTALAAVMGPVWHYANFTSKTFDDAQIDRYDVDRIKSMIPFNNLFYVDFLWNKFINNYSAKDSSVEEVDNDGS